MNGSMWSVKNWNGAVSPYSSPWKSSGVNGLKRTTAAATRRFASGSRSPTRAVADLVVVLGARDDARALRAGASSAAMLAIEPSKSA